MAMMSPASGATRVRYHRPDAVRWIVPAIEIDDPPETGGFTPFGRDNARTRSITADDARLLAGRPQSLRILLPVTIGE
jgi:hypothetical protein